MRPLHALPVIAAVVLIVMAAATVGVPDILVGMGVAAGLWREGFQGVPGLDLTLAARSLLAAGAVGLLATLLACPAAWACRSLPARWTPVLAAPLLMPSYLAYAGLNQLRAPGTWLGDWLMHAPLDQANLKPVIAARVFAIVGLALWAWPLAALVLLARFRRLDAGLLDSLRMESMGAARRVLFLASMVRAPLLAAFGMVTLVMLGSAVPFHLAQLDTYSIRLWRVLDESAPDARWQAWAGAWPLILLSLVAAVVVSRRLPRNPLVSSPSDLVATVRRPNVAVLVLAAAVWASGILLPLFLFARNVSAADLTTFWRSRADAIAGSATSAAWVAGATALLAAAFWITLAARASFPRRVAWVSLAAWLVLGLSPGVLVGSAVAAAWNFAPWARGVADTAAIVVLAHLARFGFIAALLGWWLFRSDPADERDLRLMDGADTPAGWFRAAAVPQLPVLVGGSLAAALLSFHEIEAGIFVQPPGSGLFAQVVLELLHFERRTDLSAAAVTVLGGGIVVAAATAALLSLGRSFTPRPAYQQQT